MRIASSRLATAALAGGLALLVVALIATGMSCLSVGRTSCTLETILHGRRDLDVPYAETRPEVVARMLEAADVGPADYVLDLGTGDGRILIAAARDFGARGLGVDIDPALVRAARRNAEAAGVADRTDFRAEDLFRTPLAQANVVAMYLLPEVNLRLRPRLLAELAPGARVVSNSFDMGDWRPDRTLRVGGTVIHKWTVPAQVAGRWRLDGPGRSAGTLQLDQRHQFVSGAFQAEGEAVRTLVTGRIDGDRMTLHADLGDGETAHPVRIEADRLIAEGRRPWQARRVPPGEGGPSMTDE